MAEKILAVAITPAWIASAAGWAVGAVFCAATMVVEEALGGR